MTGRLIYANTNLLFSTAVGALLFLLVQKGTRTASCVPNISQIKDLGCLCKRARSRPTVLRIPFCRRIVSKTLHKRTFELLTLSTCKNTFHSLRQYLECDFYLWIYFTCTSVFSSVLLARKSNLVLFIFHILLTRISQSINLLFSFLISHFAFCILHFAFN